MSAPSFKLEPPPDRSERDIQRDVLQYLQYDSRVAWAYRFNTGAHAWDSMDSNGKVKRNFVRYAFPGCSDILGQMSDGRFLAVEIKTRKGKLTAEQKQFLDIVGENNGVAFVARSVADVIERLGKCRPN